MSKEHGHYLGNDFDTIVVPAHPNGFDEVFVGRAMWPNLKIDKRRLSDVQFIAVYQTKPVSAITHYAKIKQFKPLERVGRYDVTFAGHPIPINPVKFTPADICALQGPRYTRLELLLKASSLSRAFPN